MKRVFRYSLILLGLIVAVGGAGYVLKSMRPAPAPVAEATANTGRFEGMEFSPADLTPVVLADLHQAVRLSGTVQPLDQSVIKAEVAATVVDVTVRRGEAVRKGQLLAKLDTRDLTARFREKENNLEGARAALALAEINRNKIRTLVQSGVRAQSSMDETENAYLNAKANVQALEQQVAQARKALGDAAVYAPLDGLVGDRMINPGERVAVDAKLFAIADLATMEMEALVPARDVPRLGVGQRVELRVEGFGDRTFPGEIERINPTAQSGSRSIPVYIRLPNPDRLLRGGMFGSGEAILSEARQAISVPADALRRDQKGAHVFVVVDGRVERRAVDVALSDTVEGMVALGQGVKPGEQVVVPPGLKLVDGLAARIAAR